jgi:chromate transporter
MSDLSRLPSLGAQFAVLSLLAVGGTNAVAPEMHRQMVVVSHWMSNREFAQMFAVAQAAPGPNLIVATIIGWRVAGGWGALVATLAMCAPSSIGVYAAWGLWRSVRDRPWRAWVQAGIAPVVIGLIGASGFLLAKGADADWRGAAVTAASAALIWRTRLNPLWILCGAAILGVAGLV